MPDAATAAQNAAALAATDEMGEIPTIADDPTPGPHAHGKSPSLLALAALGVVFGDIGTSPLYSMQTLFAEHHGIITPTRGNVFGVISMVVWAVLLIVSLKYVIFVMRAHNEGEGGILALVALLKDRLAGRKVALTVVIMSGIIGAGLFYGDSVITPAISVMSAIEGLQVVNPALEEWVLPVSALILLGLFSIQRFGTSKVGNAFGPIMAVWFVVLAVLGVPHIWQTPGIAAALSPHYAVLFALQHPWPAFIALGAVVLTITGAEALYADMGHFGATPIRRSWFLLVWPSLILNYLGQGAMLLDHPEFIDNPFFRLAPSWATIPLVVLATIATVIASQSVISGAFSVSRQASRLKFLPRMSVRHTSKSEGGQIYISSINWILFIGVLLLILVFQTSTRLATAYGLAVTGTLILTTVLFLILAREVWGWARWKVVLFAVVIGGTELVIFSANLLKLASGGWIPVLLAGIVVLIMTTWRRGVYLMSDRRAKVEGSLTAFIDKINAEGTQRVPGIAVFPHPNKETTPLALKGNYQFNHVVHEKVIICNIINEPVPHIRHIDREHLDEMGELDDGVYYLDCHVGFNDSQDVPKAIKLAFETFPEFEGMQEDDVMYFLSVGDIKRDVKSKRMQTWRKQLFIALQKAQADRNVVFHTPKERTVVLGSELFL